MNEFLWFLWKWAFDPTAVVRTPEGEVVDIERFPRRDYWAIFQPNSYRFRFCEKQRPCGCQYRIWGTQVLFCMDHSGTGEWLEIDRPE